MSKAITFSGSPTGDPRIIAIGWQSWGKKRTVMRVMYFEKRHPSAKYFLMEKIGRRWYEFGHYHSLAEATSIETMAYKRQLTAK
ncbi:hypothetical protein [Chitinophaga sp. MM2321]|uniref:hypothetical protein n=1 Tax=Chitinophaga sp. MM2321 TaxID=3137178 RepID=UPI0032D5854B